MGGFCGVARPFGKKILRGKFPAEERNCASTKLMSYPSIGLQGWSCGQWLSRSQPVGVIGTGVTQIVPGALPRTRQLGGLWRGVVNSVVLIYFSTPRYVSPGEWIDRSLRVTRFKYLGSVTTDDGSKPEILSRIAQATAALTRLKRVWNDRSSSLSYKIRLKLSLVTSIFLYACESWTLTAELQRRIQTMEMSCYRKILRISYKRPCYQRGSPYRDPACNRTTRRPPDHCKETLTAVIWICLPFTRCGLQSTVKRWRRQGRQRKRWEDNIRGWTDLELAKSQRAVENREEWR